MHWAGNGESLCSDDQSETNIIFDFGENISRVLKRIYPRKGLILHPDFCNVRQV